MNGKELTKTTCNDFTLKNPFGFHSLYKNIADAVTYTATVTSKFRLYSSDS